MTFEQPQGLNNLQKGILPAEKDSTDGTVLLTMLADENKFDFFLHGSC
jgi:hypothetical protein